MTDKEKLDKVVSLADAMYYAAQYLTTDASRLHKTMEDYHQFIINEYYKEEPVSEDLNQAATHHKEMVEGANRPHTTFSGVDFVAGAQWEKAKSSIPMSEDVEEDWVGAVDTAANKYIKETLPASKKFPIKSNFIYAAFKSGAIWQKIKSIVDTCYHLEIRLPLELDYNGTKVERKDFIEDFRKALNQS